MAVLCFVKACFILYWSRVLNGSGQIGGNNIWWGTHMQFSLSIPNIFFPFQTVIVVKSLFSHRHGPAAFEIGVYGCHYITIRERFNGKWVFNCREMSLKSCKLHIYSTCLSFNYIERSSDVFLNSFASELTSVASPTGTNCRRFSSASDNT